MTRLTQLVPTRADLEHRAELILEEIDLPERQAWTENRCTQALFILLEAARMQAIEAMEEGPTPEQLTQFMAQAQLAHSLTEDLHQYIVNLPEKPDAYEH